MRSYSTIEDSPSTGFQYIAKPDMVPPKIHTSTALVDFRQVDLFQHRVTLVGYSYCARGFGGTG